MMAFFLYDSVIQCPVIAVDKREKLINEKPGSNVNESVGLGKNRQGQNKCK
jgi:hypothetical protein